ncbi:MAG: HAD family hydrolase [Treponema sp.]|jgi:FMN phosphatase YigB (HAD superfamily)|nr:HAD family hydrolase [Treponema sp.]
MNGRPAAGPIGEYGGGPDFLRGLGAIIFDLDGTLYDQKGIARRLVLARPLDAFLMRAERQTRKQFAGRSYGTVEAYFQAFFEELSKQIRRSASFARTWYFETYMPLMTGILAKHYRARPGAAEVFAALASGANGLGGKIPFAVYSDYPMAAARLEAIGLDRGSCRVYGPQDFGAQKPAAAPFLRIAGDLGSAPQDTLVAGDRDDTDGAGAAAAGMRYFSISAPAWERFCSWVLPRKHAH